MFPPYTPDWSRTSTSTGYRVVYCPDHPRAWSTGYVYVHQIVAELKLGRLLEDGEIVHHIDEKRMNNSPENIAVTTLSKHSRHHSTSKGKAMVKLRCPTCKTTFTRRRGQTHLVKPSKTGATCCSSTCRGTMTMVIKQGGQGADKMRQEISRNVVEEFRRHQR